MSQVDKDLVAKARAEASTARQRWKDAKDPRSKGEGERPLMEDRYQRTIWLFHMAMDNGQFADDLS